jgi:PilZ domain
METKRFNAYNSTRGTVLNSKLAVADRELEPLKFLELLIGGLGLDSESGVWLKPLAGAPQVPRVFPFDLVYLDENQKVIQAAEVFPGGEFPPFSDEVFSALVLPLSAVSTTKTRPGDQLLVRTQEELSEQTQESPQPAPHASHQTQEIALQPAEAPQQSLEVLLQIQEVIPQTPDPPQLALELTPKVSEVAPRFAEPSESPEVPLQIQEVVPESTEPPEKLLELTPKFPKVVLPAELSQQASDVALEAPHAVLQPPETSSTPQEASPQTSPGADGKKSQLSESSSSSPSATSVVDRKPRKAPGTTASAPGSTMQSVGFTVAQYRSWQGSTSTAQAPVLKGEKSPIQKPETEDSSNPPQAVSKADAENSARATDSAQSILQPSPQREMPASREAKNARKSSLPDRVTARRRELLLDAAKAPLISSTPPIAPITETGKTTDNEPLTAAGSHSTTPDTSAKLQEPPLPLWKASPSPLNSTSASAQSPAVSQSRQESAEQPRRAMPAPSSGESANRVEKQKPAIQKVAGRAAAKPVVEQPPQPSSPPSRMPETLSRLMTAFHRIGGNSEAQSPAGEKGPAANQLSSWLDPEALHRDRRRAVRRAVPGLVAYYFTGGAPQPYTVADISATGFFLLTRDQWMPETMILMTLQKPVADRKRRRESITVLTKIVRRAGDGIGAEFVMPESLDPNIRDIKPSRATDRMALARFLFSEDFSDSFEALGCFIAPPTEQPPGV